MAAVKRGEWWGSSLRGRTPPWDEGERGFDCSNCLVERNGHRLWGRITRIQIPIEAYLQSLADARQKG